MICNVICNVKLRRNLQFDFCEIAWYCMILHDAAWYCTILRIDIQINLKIWNVFPISPPFKYSLGMLIAGWYIIISTWWYIYIWPWAHVWLLVLVQLCWLSFSLKGENSLLLCSKYAFAQVCIFPYIFNMHSCAINMHSYAFIRIQYTSICINFWYALF